MQILRTPPDILIAFLKTWDKIAEGRVGEEPVLQEGARLAARLRFGGGAGEALHASRRTRSPPTTTCPRRQQRRRGEEEVALRCCERGRHAAPVSLARRADCRAARSEGSAWPNRSPCYIRLVRDDRQVHRHHRHLDRVAQRAAGRWRWPTRSIARYVFDAPTIWSFDVTYMLYGDASSCSARPTRCTRAPTSAPTSSSRTGRSRTKGMIDSVAYIVFFFPL